MADLGLQQGNINKSSYSSEDLFVFIDFLQEWASVHSCKTCKDEILKYRKDLMLELENRYINNIYL